MEASTNPSSESTQGRSPPREENTGNRNLHPEDEVVLKRVIGKALEAFTPTMVSKIEEIVTVRLNEFVQKYPNITNPPPNTEATTAQHEKVKEKDQFEYKGFASCKPPEFLGELNPVISTRWLSELEETFLLCKCSDELRVLFAAHQLKGSAHEWWNSQVETYGFETASKFSWDKFKEIFKEEFSPPAELEKLKGEFLAIDHGSKSVAEYSKSFHEKARFCPEYTSNPKLLTDHFYRHLNIDIRESIDPTIYDTMAKMLNRALVREKDLQAKIVETISKRKVEHTTTSQPAPLKKLRFEETQPQPQPLQQYRPQTQTREIPLCDKCGRSHTGECKCFKCGRPGHMAPNCPSPYRLCYYCFKDDHLQFDCPDKKEARRKELEAKLVTTGSRSRPRSFQLIAGEAKESSDVASGTLSF